MHIRLMTGVLTIVWVLIASSPLFAQNALMSRAEKRVYHACLYAHWIDGYCRVHSWSFFSDAFSDCIIANSGCQCALANGGYWGPEVNQACAAAMHYPGR